jgi:hypothetical protein
MAKKSTSRRRSTRQPAAVTAPPEEAVVATDADNAKLEHTDDRRDQSEIQAAGAAGTPLEPLHEEGRSMTTRDDRLDLGVPMLPGSPDEPQGPEDALGEGETRGDYRQRIGPPDYDPHEGATPQRPRADEIGDVEGRKGGVETGS